AAAPRQGPDRPGVRAAAGRRIPGPGSPHVSRAPQPQVQARLPGIPLQLPDDPPHRTGHGAPPPRRPLRHGGVLRRRLFLAGDVQHPLHRTGGDAAQHLQTGSGDVHGGHPRVRGETGHQTGQESRSARAGAAISM
ncbi:Transcriptional regulator, AraC family, partial [Arthrobacter sp. DR-2P]